VRGPEIFRFEEVVFALVIEDGIEVISFVYESSQKIEEVQGRLF